MIGLDTNLLVRFLVDDDPGQSRWAREVFAALTEDAPGFVGRETVVELYWVLRRAYGLDRAATCDAIEGLIGSLEIVVEEAADVLAAVALCRDGTADFTDAMIVAAAPRTGCTELVTFDRRAARLEGVRLLEAQR